MDIREVVARRSDLSTFLVHLTKDVEDVPASDALKSILADGAFRPSKMFGAASNALRNAGLDLDSQRCVCFTETPLEHVNLLLQEIDGRAEQFEPYGIAFPRNIGRRNGVNPVWYIDITPRGVDWLIAPVNELVTEALERGNFDDHPIAKICPFIEQMGQGKNRQGAAYRKEFWWEREWRHVGRFSLPHRFLVLCPENEMEEFEEFWEDQENAAQVKFIDPKWGLERIISHLAGYEPNECEVL